MARGIGGRYRRGWVEWSRSWRPAHLLAIVAATALVTAGSLLLERSGVAGVLLFVTGVLVLGGCTPLAGVPLLGPDKRSTDPSGHGRAIWRAHVEGRKRAVLEQQERYGKRPYK